LIERGVFVDPSEAVFVIGQKSGLSAVGTLTAAPVEKSRVVSAHAISGHSPNGRR
jgi:hypothetical protein